jgi:hypothetical protein
VAALLPACGWDGHFTVLGYTTQPNYDLNIHSVRVPIFKNRTYWTVTPVVGMDVDLTRAVVREIELKTPYKVKQEGADTELKGAIVNFTKVPINYTQFGYGRDYECTLTVELFWRDLRTGQLLSRPARRPGTAVPLDPRAPVLAVPDPLTPRRGPAIPGTPTRPDTNPAVVIDDPDAAEEAERKKAELPVRVIAVSHFKPELGESLTTGLQSAYNQMAVQIVSAMEKNW